MFVRNDADHPDSVIARHIRAELTDRVPPAGKPSWSIAII